MFEFLSLKVNAITTHSINALKHYIDDEQYDTDAINMDFDHNDSHNANGNIANNIHDEKLLQKFINFMTRNQSMFINNHISYQSYNHLL